MTRGNLPLRAKVATSVSRTAAALSRAAGVVGDIIKAPVAFLGNLIAGIKGGILMFKENILDHLRKAGVIGHVTDESIDFSI